MVRDCRCGVPTRVVELQRSGRRGRRTGRDRSPSVHPLESVGRNWAGSSERVAHRELILRVAVEAKRARMYGNWSEPSVRREKRACKCDTITGSRCGSTPGPGRLPGPVISAAFERCMRGEREHHKGIPTSLFGFHRAHMTLEFPLSASPSGRWPPRTDGLRLTGCTERRAVRRNINKQGKGLFL